MVRLGASIEESSEASPRESGLRELGGTAIRDAVTDVGERSSGERTVLDLEERSLAGLSAYVTDGRRREVRLPTRRLGRQAIGHELDVGESGLLEHGLNELRETARDHQEAPASRLGERHQPGEAAPDAGLAEDHREGLGEGDFHCRHLAPDDLMQPDLPRIEQRFGFFHDPRGSERAHDAHEHVGLTDGAVEVHGEERRKHGASLGSDSSLAKLGWSSVAASEDTPTEPDETVRAAPDVDREVRFQSSTLEALRHVDASARLDMRVLAFATFACAALLQLSVHQNSLHWLTTALLTSTSVASLALHRKVKNRRGLSDAENVVTGTLCSLSALSAIAYLGTLSAVAVTICALVFGWGLGSSRPAAWGVYLTSSIGYLLLALLVATGALPLTETVLALTRENTRALIGLTLAVEMVLAISFWSAQRTRSALDRAIERTSSAQQELNRRAALLDEARAALHDLLDGAKLGPYSGRNVGPYSMADVIGRGGMGEIYRANRDDGRVAAVKVLHGSAQSDPTALERFFREAEASSALDSPHIVRLIERGTTDDGIPWLALELLDGMDLGRYLRQRGRLAMPECQELVGQLARALSAAEQAGIVHRDIKPQNVFRSGSSERPLWKLLDFGVSKLVGITNTLTHGAAVGTPAYMSPEQVRGQEVDHRSDVYALGAIAYRSLVGRPAFSGRDALAIMYQVDQSMPLRPSALLPLPPDVDRVLALALAKDLDDRFQSAPELAHALADAARGELAEPLRRRATRLLGRYPWRELGEHDASTTPPGD